MNLIVFALLFSLVSGQRFQSRIAGGTATNIATYPWMVSIRNGQNVHICGGVIFSPIWILTVASCPVSSGSTVQYGMTTTTSTGSTAAVYRMYRHLAYAPPDTYGDIAVLRLSTSLPIGANVQVATLPAHTSPVVAAGTIAHAVGWGALAVGGAPQATLQEISLNVILIDSCRTAYASVTPLTPIYGSHICAQEASSLGGVCTGDIGGSLSVDQTVVGLTSIVATDCKTLPAVFTSILSFLCWIEQTTGLTIP